MLLKRNAKPDAQTRQGVTALMVAARLGYAEIVRAAARQEGRSQHARLHRPHGAHLRPPDRHGPAIETMLRKAGGRE